MRLHRYLLVAALAPLLGGCGCGSGKRPGGLSRQETALLRSIAAGDSAAMESIIQGGFPVNNPITIDSPRGIQHLTPLMLAAKAGHADLVARLVALGADARIKDEQGWTGLFWALTATNEDRGLAVIQYLLEGGLPLEEKSANGWTPLMVAAVSKNPEAVRYLLGRGANPNYQEPAGGASALSAAVRVGALESVKLLLGAKADPNMKIPNRGCPLTLTAAATVLTPADQEIAQLMLQHGANPNLIGDDGSTPLTAALLESKTELAKVLLQFGADPNLAERVQGRTPLMICVLTRNYDMARALIAGKADPYLQRKSDKATAFTMAQEQNDPQMFAVLAGR